jgi:hypothetical protein
MGNSIRDMGAYALTTEKKYFENVKKIPNKNLARMS